MALGCTNVARRSQPVRLGVQLYTLRESLERDFDGTLSGLAALGIRHVELAGTYDLGAAGLRSRLDAHGLSACGAHVGMDALRDDLAGVVSDAETLGHRYVVLPWVGEEDYAAGWDELGRTLSAVGASLGAAGLQFAYHNHAFEFAVSGSGTCLDALFAAADSATVQAEIDVAWVGHAGHDAGVLIRRLGSRVPLVHLKDFAGGQEAVDVAAGEGVVPWDDVLAACEEVGTAFGIIELDHPPEDPLESVRKCVAFFQSRGLSG